MQVRCDFQSDFYELEPVEVNLDQESRKELSFIVGSSAVFGVGASNDSNTISSIISEETSDKFLNFGCRAHVSSQELILFNQISPKFKKIKKSTAFFKYKLY